MAGLLSREVSAPRGARVANEPAELGRWGVLCQHSTISSAGWMWAGTRARLKRPTGGLHPRSTPSLLPAIGEARRAAPSHQGRGARANMVVRAPRRPLKPTKLRESKSLRLAERYHGFDSAWPGPFCYILYATCVARQETHVLSSASVPASRSVWWTFGIRWASSHLCGKGGCAQLCEAGLGLSLVAPKPGLRC